VPGTVLGHKAGRVTRGHRVLSKGPVRLTSAGDYIEALRGQGRVLVDFAERRNEIERQLREAARDLREGTILFAADADLRADRSAAAQEALAIVRHNDALLDEVTALVEWPVVYRGDFDAEFLRVPGACLALAMQQHQRYFPLLHPQQPGFLFPHFLVVSNMQASDPGEIVHGNERVLRARLADARFFFEQDQKTPLAARVPRLERVVYHNKLGSQFERVTRVQRIATEIARRLGLADEDIRRAKRAAFLCKADLLTEMVGEFPELQGVMGARYALHDGEDAAVAAAIREHYQPRFAGGHLPAGAIGLCIALADRLEAMIGLFGVGQAPTGDKDPFGLRRAAAGVVRMMIEGENWIKTPVTLDLRGLLEYTHMQFNAGVMAKGTVDAVSAFVYERLRSYLREGERDREFAADEIEAVLVLKPTRLDELLPRLEALRDFRRTAAGAALAAANKRINNILRQAKGQSVDSVDSSQFRETEEQDLWLKLRNMEDAVSDATAGGNYTEALNQLAALRDPVDRFFDKVLVMAEDDGVRRNRLALLAAVRAAFQHVADISQLQITATGVTERL
jgi:glycyl-tRNA synthetase beta chain